MLGSCPASSFCKVVLMVGILGAWDEGGIVRGSSNVVGEVDDFAYLGTLSSSPISLQNPPGRCFFCCMSVQVFSG